MDHGQDGMTRKYFVEVYKLRGSGVRGNHGWRVTSGEDWTKVNDSADRNSYADERKKNDSAPECAAEANSGLHTIYYAPLV